jgi:hypothetical protein
MSQHFHFPIAILTYNGNLILTAALMHPEVTARLPAGFVAAAAASLTKVTADVTGQKNAHGELGNLTAAQILNLETLQHCMNQARQTGKLAFPGQTVKLHQEFQVGVNHPNDLGSILARADIILAAVVSNLPALKLKGWTDAETSAFTVSRQTFGTTTPAQQTAKSGAKDATATKNADAADLYDKLLTIQNAADLQWPATDPANTGVRDEFRLNTFPPASGNAGGPPPPAPAK